MHAVWIFSKQKFCFRFHRDNARGKSQSVISYTEAVRMWEEESFSRASGTSPDGSLYSKIRASYYLRWRSWNRKRKTRYVGRCEALCARFPARTMSDTPTPASPCAPTPTPPTPCRSRQPKPLEAWWGRICEGGLRKTHDTSKGNQSADRKGTIGTNRFKEKRQLGCKRVKEIYFWSPLFRCGMTEISHA